MKPIDPIASLAVVLASMTPIQREAAETTILCNAIAQIESGQNYKALGDGGLSVGAWQMKVSAWITANQWRVKHGMPKIFRSAWQAPENQRQMAFAYVSWIKEQLKADGLKDPTPEQIYMAYGWGYTAYKDTNFSWDKCPDKKRDAAERVGNIYRELTK